MGINSRPDLYGDTLPYLSYIPEMESFLMDGGGLMAAFVCQPLTGVNSDVQNALEDLFKNDFPTDMFVQISMFASPDIKPILDNFEAIRGQRSPQRDTSDLLDSVATEYLHFLDKKTMEPLTEQGQMLIRNFEVWVTLTLPTKELQPSAREIKTFMAKRTALKGTLEAIHLHPTEMNGEMFLHRMQVLHNWSPNSGWRKRPMRFNASQPLRNQVLDKGSKVQVYQEGIELGNTEDKSLPKDGKFVRLLSVLKYPDVMTFGQLYSLVVDWQKGQAGIRVPFLMSLNIHYPDQIKRRDQFLKDRTYVNHMASTPFAKHIERILWQKQDYDEFNNAIERSGAQFTNSYLQIALFCDDRAHGDDVAQAVKSHGARTFWTLTDDRYFCGPLFKAALPGGQSLENMRLLQRYDCFPSNVLKHLCPIVSAWKGNGANDPVFPMVTREGQLFMWDPFVSDGNFNIAVAAASGSGKSFWANALLTHLLSSGERDNRRLVYHDEQTKPVHALQKHDASRVFIIDVGRSYMKLAEIMGSGAQFILFDDNFQYSLNPFRSITEFEGAEGQSDMLISLISYMCAPESTLTQFQSSEVANIVTAVWKKYGNEGSIDRVAEMCEESKDPRINDLARQLKQWCKGGQYGNYFRDDRPPIDYHGNFIVFELEELKSKKVLQRAVLLQCISSIQYEMFLTGKDKKKLFILDEAWEFLSDDDGGSHFIRAFLEAGWRRFRKTRAAGVAISQSVNDYYKSSVGEAIIANSQWKVLLRQEPEQIDQLQSSGKYSGDEQDFMLLKSLHTKKGEYSEIFIRGSSGAQVVRLYVSRKMQLLFTTDPKELNQIDKYKQSGHSIADAIEQVLVEEGHRKSKSGNKNRNAHSPDDILESITL